MRHGLIPTWKECLKRGFISSLSFAIRIIMRLAGEKGMPHWWLCLHVLGYDSAHTCPKSPWLILVAVFLPQTQEDFFQLWRNTDANKCYPGPAAFNQESSVTRAWARTCAKACTEMCQGRWNRELTNQECSCSGMLLHGSGVFSGMDFLEQVEGEKRVRRTTYPSPLAAPSLASPSVPSTCLGSLL